MWGFAWVIHSSPPCFVLTAISCLDLRSGRPSRAKLACLPDRSRTLLAGNITTEGLGLDPVHDDEDAVAGYSNVSYEDDQG